MQVFYVPCPDLGTAEKIATTLLQEKIVACANILPAMISMYWWEGKIDKSSEIILLLKTIASENLTSHLEKRIGELHPYKVPCIMGISPSSINDSYQQWLKDNVSPIAEAL